MQLYFLVINALVFSCGAAFLLYFGHGDARNTVAPVVTATTHSPTKPAADLTQLLAEQARLQRPAIIVAASGGGTRAALFTASALEGLKRLGVAQDIVLLSGVSGGGVASAYFYGHHEALTGNVGDAWTKYKERMAAPFIGDVLDGAGEWRVISAEPLGNLLAESFERRLFSTGSQEMGKSTRPALILNTTITGHPQEQSTLLRGMFAPASSQDCDQLHRPYSLLAGGRLIFTNLKKDDAFPDDVSVMSDVRFPYFVIRDPQIPLARAAALNANFPPVFPNARVNVSVDDTQCPLRSFYVTDGGATENLGLVSALYALSAALKALPVTSRPVIHVVAIEASAVSYDYKQDRGIGAAAGGSKERLVGGLTGKLLAEVCTQTGAPKCDDSRLQLHYLTLPFAFRSRGGFGTHWMLPETIDITNPRLPTPPTAWAKITSRLSGQPQDSVTIGHRDLMQLWAALHDPKAAFCNQSYPGDQQTIANWVCGTGTTALPADLHITQWRALVKSLR